jgi:hypothetical protein
MTFTVFDRSIVSSFPCASADDAARAGRLTAALALCRRDKISLTPGRQLILEILAREGRQCGAIFRYQPAANLFTTPVGRLKTASGTEKSAYAFVPRCAPGREGFPAHSSRFEIDEGVLPVGAKFFYEVARLAGDVLKKR